MTWTGMEGFLAACTITELWDMHIRHFHVDSILETDAWEMPTHLEWNNDWQPVHSSSGKPLTPGQYGVHGLIASDWALDRISPDADILLDDARGILLGGSVTELPVSLRRLPVCCCIFAIPPCGEWAIPALWIDKPLGKFGGRGIGVLLLDLRLVAWVDAILFIGLTTWPEGRLLTFVDLGCDIDWPLILTGGCILLSITTYFWSFEAENDKVVPVFTFKATFLGTLSNTGLAWGPPFCCLTRIDLSILQLTPAIQPPGML